MVLLLIQLILIVVIFTFPNLLNTTTTTLNPGDTILINIINQLNNLTIVSNSNLTLNRLFSENVLSRTPSQAGLLQSTDDFIIPNKTYFNSMMNITNSNGKIDCSSIQITLETIRTKTVFDPLNITIQFIKNNFNSPSDSDIIFTKTFLSPIGGWNDSTLNTTNLMIFTINNGDIDDNNQTIFNLTNSSFLSENEIIWISFYASLNLNPNCYRDPSNNQRLICVQNGMYWISYYNYNNQSSSLNPFYFRDVNNLLRKNLMKWTTATTVLPLLSMNVNLINLAFSISLNCTIPFPSSIPPPPSIPIIIPTEEPTINIIINTTEEPTTNSNTNSTTINPTEEVTNPTEEPTIEMTNIPTEEGEDSNTPEILTNVPTTEEPTEIPTSFTPMPTNIIIVEQPTNEPTIKPLNNETLQFDNSNPMELFQTLLIAVLVPAFFLFIVIILLLLYYKRRRDKIDSLHYQMDIDMNDFNNNNSSNIRKRYPNREGEEEEDIELKERVKQVPSSGLKGKSMKQLYHDFKVKVDDESKGRDDSSEEGKQTTITTKASSNKTWRGKTNYEKIDLLSNVQDEGARNWLNKNIVVPINSTDDDSKF